jgi:outer membrane protein TolC
MEERYKVNASTFVELMETRASALQSSYNLIKARYDLLVKGIAVLYYSGTIEKTMPFLD